MERAFILQLLGSAGVSHSKEVLKQSAVDYIKGFDPSSHAFPQHEQLQKQYYDRVELEPYNCLFRAAAAKNVISDPDVNSPELEFTPPGAKQRIGSGDRDATVTGLLQNSSLEVLDPQWIRPLPPRLPIQDGKLVWLNLDNNHELLWDHGMCADTSRGAEWFMCLSLKRNTRADDLSPQNPSHPLLSFSLSLLLAPSRSASRPQMEFGTKQVQAPLLGLCGLGHGRLKKTGMGTFSTNAYIYLA